MKELPSQEALDANAKLLERRKQVKIDTTTTHRIKGGEPIPEVPVDVQAMLESLKKTGERAAEHRKMIEQHLLTVQSEWCNQHNRELKPDLNKSVRISRETGRTIAAFELCPDCERVHGGLENWKIKAGIPLELIEASLENWTPRNKDEAEHLRKVEQFKKMRAGFLLMLGERGTGKSHLSAALLSHFRSGLMLTQADLLGRLRKSYSDKSAEDIVERAKRAKILIIDEMGLSAGGRDEFPMIHEILSHRHSNYKPTVLNGNITPREFQEVVGSRMIDRLKQSLFMQLIFTGDSNRPNLRAEYPK